MIIPYSIIALGASLLLIEMFLRNRRKTKRAVDVSRHREIAYLDTILGVRGSERRHIDDEGGDPQ